jgi:hypothetical protein
LTFRARFDLSAWPSAPPRGADAWRVVAEAAPLVEFARSRTTQTAVVDMDGIGRVVRKRWTWPRRRDRLKGALRTTWAARSPARREFEALGRLHALSFAPTPLGFVERRERGVLRECVLLLEEIADATDLATRLAKRGRGDAAQLLALLARRVRAMHDAGLVDFEMHPRNVLVAPDGDVLKVDCAKQHRGSRPASAADRARDLAALDVGLVRLATSDERTVFFDAYGADRRLRDLVDRARRRIDGRESARLPKPE